jgi:hypothetical protein
MQASKELLLCFLFNAASLHTREEKTCMHLTTYFRKNGTISNQEKNFLHFQFQQQSTNTCIINLLGFLCSKNIPTSGKSDSKLKLTAESLLQYDKRNPPCFFLLL